ncbi:MAG: hypothetical protein E5W59_02990 [Mesorhizobium sp.]|uniref:hypothetical protein n=1 Tax=Mesorhizobium sp. TaxID=1871066 RepID=UPI000FE96A7A|nr:hypothetical protein [Mesorhizobium sp.]RWD36102.1 MAG: hypothetical protein EOS33_05475 [Mesorhizobium sp.]TIT95082.1 MAG: hypothetical protein E5W59_02990 [Mesorhizobium sp.]
MTGSGASVGGGDMPPEQRTRADQLIRQFEVELQAVAAENGIARRYIRPLLGGSVICGSFEDRYFVGYKPHLGVPTIIFTSLQATGNVGIQQYLDWLSDTFGDGFSAVELQEAWLNQPATLRAVAVAMIQAELVHNQPKGPAAQMNPVFGPNIYPVQEKLVFVLMPFEADLTAIYESFVKPTVESKNLICRRADDLHTNNAIMQDIWKSICEARIVIADLTNLNPNVMYELGISHTVGKETILIHQNKGQVHFPFDVTHFRILTYTDTATGGDELKRKLSSTIDSVLEKIRASVSP